MNHLLSCRFLLLGLPVFAAFLLVTSCTHKRVAVPAFYYWKTTYQLKPNEKQLLDSTGTKLLYIRFFDVTEGWDPRFFQVLPEGKIEFKEHIPAGTTVVPVVYITNRALETLDTNNINELASKMRRKLTRMCDNSGITKPIEFQLDCDWTQKTGDRYFKLIKAFKEQVSPAKVSVTIRLHQYKYASKTGTPPADKGLLMLYNMGHIQNENEKNYILDIEEVKKYLDKKVSYGLPLDIGLPIYSQGVCYNGTDNDGYVSIIKAEEMEEDIANGWLKNSTDNWYLPSEGKPGTQQHTYGSNFRVRYERITPEKLMQAANLVKDIVANDTCKVVFFHLDSLQCNNFKANDFNKVVGGF